MVAKLTSINMWEVYGMRGIRNAHKNLVRKT